MATVSGGTTTERFAFVQTHGRDVGVRYLCWWLNVSRSGYYAWLKRKESARSIANRQLLQRIVQIHRDSAGVYGSPRIHRALQQQGQCVGRKRVENIMREAGVVGKVATLYRRVPGMERFYLKHQNLRLQAPPPSDVDQQWVADLTYIKVADRWQYLAVVMDVYSRRIIGWSLGAKKTAELTLRALRQALSHRQATSDLIFHADNAHMESFFSQLKS